MNFGSFILSSKKCITGLLLLENLRNLLAVLHLIKLNYIIVTYII